MVWEGDKQQAVTLSKAKTVLYLHTYISKPIPTLWQKIKLAWAKTKASNWLKS